MWNRTIQVHFKGHTLDVLVFLSDSTEGGQEVVSLKSMYCEYYLGEDITFNDRDTAYLFIRYLSKRFVRGWVIGQIYDNIPQENF